MKGRDIGADKQNRSDQLQNKENKAAQAPLIEAAGGKTLAQTSVASPARQVSIALSEKIIRRRTISDAVQHPTTLLSAGVCLASASYLLLLSPMFGGGEVAIVIASISGLAAISSYGFRYPRLFERNTTELTLRFDIEREQTEQEQLDLLRKTLKSGFAGVNSSEGLEILDQLSHEYEQLQASLAQQRFTDPLALSVIPALADETYRRGLGVLSDTLELINIARTQGKDKLEQNIARVEHEIQLVKNDQSRLDWLKLKGEVLASLKERLSSLSRLNLWSEQLLNQARRCEATLHSARIELAQVRAGGAKSNLDSIIQTLEERIRQVKEVQEEINKLGY